MALSTVCPDGDMIHEVKHGQTLWHSAIQYGTTAEQISGSPATHWLRGRPTQGTTVSSPDAANLVRQNSTVVAALLISFSVWWLGL